MREPAPGDRDGWAVYADWLIERGAWLRLAPAEVADVADLASGSRMRPAPEHARLIGARLCVTDGGWLQLTPLGRRWTDAAFLGWVR